MQQFPFFTRLRILFFALLFGQTIFAAIAYVIFGIEDAPIEQSSNDVLVYVAVLYSITAMGAGYVLKPRLVKSAAEKSNLDEKLKAYTTASLINWAILEGANLLNIVVFIITDNRISLVFFLAILLVYIPTKPDLRKIAEELNLSRKEQEEIGV